MTNLTGQSYTAKLDGTEAPYEGDPGITSVSVLRLGEHAFVETDKRDGKAVRNTRVMILAGDEKTIHMIVANALHATSVSSIANKQ